jgi:hypothetical protein
MRARWSWHKDELKLRTAYLGMWQTAQQNDLGQYSNESTDANVALDNLRDDLAQLTGADDHGAKEIFLERSERCVQDQGFALSPTQQKPSDYCRKLIVGDNP